MAPNTGREPDAAFGASRLQRRGTGRAVQALEGQSDWTRQRKSMCMRCQLRGTGRPVDGGWLAVASPHIHVARVHARSCA